MAIDKVGPVGGATPSPQLETGKEKFGKVLDGVQKVGGQGGQPQGAQNPASNAQQPSEVSPRQVVDRARPNCPPTAQGVKSAQASGAPQAVQRVEAKANVRAMEPAKVLDQVAAAQQRLDHILQLAQGGKSFTPAELLAMQAHIYRASQELDLAGKVVEKATGGVKQVLQTQV